MDDLFNNDVMGYGVLCVLFHKLMVCCSCLNVSTNSAYVKVFMPHGRIFMSCVKVMQGCKSGGKAWRQWKVVRYYKTLNVHVPSILQILRS